MKRKIMVIAPHADDETLGCGGTLLKHFEQGDETHWVLITGMANEYGYSYARIEARNREIEQVAAKYNFTSVHKLQLPPARLDHVPLAELVDKLCGVVKEVEPDTLYLPYRGDIHSDHKVVFDAAMACTKWFRYPSVKRVLVYETLSETEFNINPDVKGFSPNVFNDISPYLSTKLEIMNLYAGEVASFPFPRSEKTITALANLRGSMAGCEAAEAFMLLKEIL